MKTLLLMRHAKSSWKHDGLTDHERPLNERGQRDAPRMGHWLRKQQITPDVLLVSSAVRARRTAEAVADALNCADRIQLLDALYGAGPSDYATMLRELPDKVKTAMIIAHDPTMSEIVSALRGSATEMPTAAIACFDISIDSWNAFSPPIQAKLRALWLPRDLEANADV